MLVTLFHVVHFLKVDEHEKLAGRIGVDVLETAGLDVLDELSHILETRLDFGDFEETTVGRRDGN